MNRNMVKWVDEYRNKFFKNESAKYQFDIGELAQILKMAHGDDLPPFTDELFNTAYFALAAGFSIGYHAAMNEQKKQAKKRQS